MYFVHSFMNFTGEVNKVLRFNDLPANIKQYIFVFLQLKQFNYLYCLFRLEPNYYMYFKHNLSTAPETIKSIIMGGACTLSLVKFIYPEHLEIPISDTRLMMYYASDTNYLQLFKYLYYRSSEETLYECLFLFDKSKLFSLEIVKFLYTESVFLKYKHCGDFMMSTATILNKIDIIEFLHKELGINLSFNLFIFLSANNVKKLCKEKIVIMFIENQKKLRLEKIELVGFN